MKKYVYENIKKAVNVCMIFIFLILIKRRKLYAKNFAILNFTVQCIETTFS
jgi:hypothetical protein